MAGVCQVVIIASEICEGNEAVKAFDFSTHSTFNEDRMKEFLCLAGPAAQVSRRPRTPVALIGPAPALDRFPPTTACRRGSRAAQRSARRP